jgi:hypothetical protein
MLLQLISYSSESARSIIGVLRTCVRIRVTSQTESQYHSNTYRSITHNTLIAHHILLILSNNNTERTYVQQHSSALVIHSSLSPKLFLTSCVIVDLSTSDRKWEASVWQAFYTRVNMQEASSKRVRPLKASTYHIHSHITDSHNATSTQFRNITDEHTDLQQHRSVSGIVQIYSFARP